MTFTTSRDVLTRGTLAKRAGCHIETVRYYEKIGLLAPPARSVGGHRQYREADQRRLRFILRARELGFPIEELRSLLSMVDEHAYTCGEIQAMTMTHLTSVRDRIRDLQRLERTLSVMAERCSGDQVPDCAIIEEMLGEPTRDGG
ncbi:helix-turn-helix domain-containing protein [Thalassobaculum sp.]|jgi:MerR family mercuric resistance operon transcriptional regulator|uniref:MerR family transcriptional regulator n=1 Tax=Thalassobaculum sp. TaxID=2022740 RepID=UPI0032EEC3A3